MPLRLEGLTALRPHELFITPLQLGACSCVSSNQRSCAGPFLGITLRPPHSQVFETRMSATSVPEMQRAALEETCLQIKALSPATQPAPPPAPPLPFPLTVLHRRTTVSIEAFLGRALSPPEPLAVRLAIDALQQMGAIDSTQELTPLGKILSK